MAPYRQKGKCVYKKNQDGSIGEKVGCSQSTEGAKKYLKALYRAHNKKKGVKNG